MTKYNIRRGERIGKYLPLKVPYMTLNSVSYSFPSVGPPTGQVFHLTGLKGILQVDQTCLPPFSTSPGGFNPPYNPLDVKITVEMTNDKTQRAPGSTPDQGDQGDDVREELQPPGDSQHD